MTFPSALEIICKSYVCVYIYIYLLFGSSVRREMEGRAAGGVRPPDLEGRGRGRWRRKGAGKLLERKDIASKRGKSQEGEEQLLTEKSLSPSCSGLVPVSLWISINFSRPQLLIQSYIPAFLILGVYP